MDKHSEGEATISQWPSCMTTEITEKMAWEFARKVADSDKQLLSSNAVRCVAAMLIATQDTTARRCAEIAEEYEHETIPIQGKKVALYIAAQIRREFGLGDEQKCG